MSNPDLKSLQAKVRRAPNEPGVYLMKDDHDRVIYVGKAKRLKRRLESYFIPRGELSFKTSKLVNEVYDFDLVIVNTELEALLTERAMIRTHNPKFNILLRDDKEYPYVRIDMQEPWPRLEKVRKRQQDGAEYRGPFGSASMLGLAMKMTGRIFPLIRCSRHEFKHAKRVCTYYHLKMCMGPCAIEVNRDDYLSMMKNALALIDGRSKETEKALEAQMKESSKLQRYEHAAQIRDQLRALRDIGSHQSAVVQDIEDADVIGVLVRDDLAAIHVLRVRSGRLNGSDAFTIAAAAHDTESLLVAFCSQYYESRSLPNELIINRALTCADDLGDEMKNLAELNQEDSAPKISLCPTKGNRADLLEMAERNAEYQLDEHQKRGSRRRSELKQVHEVLELSRFPTRIECIDISNMQGSAIVASNVVFIDGKPAKDLYRIYNVETVKDGPDDFQSMREIVRRRLERAARDEDAPDLLVIDGGKGQLSAAMDAFKDFPSMPCDLVSLAKSHVQSSSESEMAPLDRTDERVFLVGRSEPIALELGTPCYRLLTQLRDEAHRFAITHHRKKRNRETIKSALDEISGVGPKLKTRLLKEFGSIDAIRFAGIDRLRSLEGISEALAIRIHTALNSEGDGQS